MNLAIRRSTVAEFEAAPNFIEILDEYAEELAVKGLPHPKAKIETYYQLESIGVLHPIGAYIDNTIIGFINVLMAVNPHYGIAIACSQSYFVSNKYRETGAGLKLRSEAEAVAQELKSPGFIISGPAGGTLVEILEKSKSYEELSRSFFKSFSYA